MKILLVSPFLPYPPDNGGAIRIYNFLRYLSEQHNITLLCYLDGSLDYLKRELDPYCHVITLPQPHQKRNWFYHAKYLFSELPYSLVYIDNLFKEKLIDLASQDFDLVQFEFLPFAHYVDFVPTSIRKVAVVHYIATESRKRLMRLWKPSLKKLYYRLDIPKINAYEQRILSKFDLCLVTSKAHKQKLVDRGIKSRTILSPNGVDTKFFTPLTGNRFDKSQTLHPTFAYMGAFHLEPANIDGLEYLIEKILPIIREKVPNIQLEIIGKGLPPYFEKKYGNKNIVFHGYMDDIRPVLGRAHALLLSLRGGSGTKIRILTAMAMGIPVVATSVAAEGIDGKHNENILIADTPESFATESVRLLREADLSSKIGSAGRTLVEDKYSWETVAKDLGDLYLSL